MKHYWRIVKYNGNLALYALCDCGFHYCASHNSYDENGHPSFKQTLNEVLYNYCPICGDRKLYHTESVEHINKFPFEY